MRLPLSSTKAVSGCASTDSMRSALTMIFSPFNLVTSIMEAASRVLFYLTDLRDFNNHALRTPRKVFLLHSSDQASRPGKAFRAATGPAEAANLRRAAGFAGKTNLAGPGAGCRTEGAAGAA